MGAPTTARYSTIESRAVSHIQTEIENQSSQYQARMLLTLIRTTHRRRRITEPMTYSARLSRIAGGTWIILVVDGKGLVEHEGVT